MKKLFLIAMLALTAPSFAHASGDVEKGRTVYERLCWWCHGREGEGDGPAARYLNPPPRDFTMGEYKWKSTPYDEIMPTDEDYRRMIAGVRRHDTIPGWDGLNNTSMPGWADVLGGAEISDVIAYIKSLAEMEAPEAPAVAFKSVSSTRGSLERGRELYLDRCSGCHGRKGRGDGEKRLKDDWGARTWPRDLTKGWTFRAGSDAGAVYTRITVGIPGTQMPSFADPVSKKVMTDEQRRDVANYVVSLNAPYKRPGADNVVRAARVDGALPGPRGKAWDSVPFVSLYLVPQIVAGQRLYTPTVDSISVKAMHNSTELAVYVEWDDPTESIPGVKKAEDIAAGEVFPDRVALEFPATFERGGVPPYFGMGSATGAVNIWSWQSPSGPGRPGGVGLMDARGAGKITMRNAGAAGLTATGYYDHGTWTVVFKRPLDTGDDMDIRLGQGVFTPVAFATWDGSNNEKGSRHTMTGWASIMLEPGTDKSVYLWPAIIAIIVLCMEMLWLKNARKG
ncbi:MAG: ethylbenzene dehydrogenase-related protein [Thermodesulfobacteriota bacterium]